MSGVTFVAGICTCARAVGVGLSVQRHDAEGDTPAGTAESPVPDD